MHKTAAGHRAVQEKRANLSFSRVNQPPIKKIQWVGKKMERKCVWEVSCCQPSQTGEGEGPFVLRPNEMPRPPRCFQSTGVSLSLDSHWHLRLGTLLIHWTDLVVQVQVSRVLHHPEYYHTSDRRLAIYLGQSDLSRGRGLISAWVGRYPHGLDGYMELSTTISTFAFRLSVLMTDFAYRSTYSQVNCCRWQYKCS